MGSLYINDTEVDFDESSREKNLLKFIRDDLKLKGTKDGCGIGRCGACTVLVNGAPKRACRLTLKQVEGKEVLTIEGLGTRNSLHPIQQAFIDAGAIQCGFCTPGMILASKALLDKVPEPNEEEIKRALSANLCRCTGYNSIISAVKLASCYLKESKTSIEKLLSKDNATRMYRNDAIDKALGKSVFGDDIEIADCLYAGAVRSPHPHAAIIKIDYSKALLVPGVVDVWTAHDVPGVNYYQDFINDQPVLAENRIRYKGEPVAVVVAESPETVLDGIAKVEVDYEVLKPIFNMEKALDSACKIHDTGNLLMERNYQTGDINRAFSDASIIVEGSFSTPCVEHAYLEPEAGTAYVDAEGIITVFGPTQAPHHHRNQLALFLGTSPDMVRVKQSVIGGAFGSKHDLSIQCLIALSTVRTGRPVKMKFSREESFLVTVKRHPFKINGRICGTKKGEITGLDMDFLADTGAYSAGGPAVLARAVYHASGPYVIPNVSIKGRLVYTNNPVSSAMRGFGVPQVTFAIESLVDMFAKKCGLDPLRVREKNALRAHRYSSIGQKMAEDVGFIKSISEIKRRHCELQKNIGDQTGKIKRGIGVASLWYGIGGTNVINKAGAKIVLDSSGKIVVYSGTTELGQGSNIIYAQIVAGKLKQNKDDIKVITGDSLLCPDASSTNASRQTYLSGNALAIACEKLRCKILDVASIKTNAPVNDIEVIEGGIKILSANKVYTFPEIIDEHIMGFGEFEVELPNLVDGNKAPYKIYSFGTILAEVSVNINTGNVKVNRVVAAYDCGKIVNYETAVGQSEGGIIMGLGYALQEKFDVGRTRNFDTYKIPSIRDSCNIETVFVEGDKLDGPLGVKGLGEIPILAVAPAIINAINNACGVRIYDLPVTKEKLLKLLNSEGIH